MKVLVLGVAAAVVLSAVSARAAVVEKTTVIAGLTVHYTVVLPDGYDPARSYPAVLAFSGGSQAENTVQMDLRRNWREQAERRGYIVVIAAAPEGRLFFQGGERIFPAFLDLILADYRILDGTFNVAGPSNGGISAFTVAAAHPQYFVSVTGFPGYLQDISPARMEALSGLCIYMFAGERDQPWSAAMNEQSKAFLARGMKVQTSLEAGQPHLIDSLAGEGAGRLFDQFDESRRGC